jgi:hypothetical protein
MSFSDVLAGVRNCEVRRETAEAQKQWLENGTVSAEYLRAQVRGSFRNRTTIEDMVRDALKKVQGQATERR